jgi:Ca-activated chloride channel family protein
MSLVAPLALFLGALIPVLVIFYFLKLKRPRLEVPSLVLWKQVISDNRVNSPFQKFKRNILLLLQLLLLILLIFAATQPYFRGDPANTANTPYLIDCSASMAALDKKGGITRLAEAKNKIKVIIDQLDVQNQRICLISFGRTARKLTGFTNNKRILREALADIKIQDVSSDIEDAMRTAEALSRTRPFDRVVMYSDNNFPTDVKFDIPFNIEHAGLEPAAANIGITQLNARYAGRGIWHVFTKVQSSAAVTATAELELHQDGKKIDSSALTVSSEQAQRLTFQISATSATNIEVHLKPDGFDSLSVDNVAYLDLNPGRPLSVFSPTSLDDFRIALKEVERVNLHPKVGKKPDAAMEFDLIITDDLKDTERRAPITFVVGKVPKDLEGLLSIDNDGTVAVDWRRQAEVLKYVELTDLIILDNPVQAQDVRESDYEALGYEVLAFARQGPLLLSKHQGDRTTFYLMFHTDRSTFPYRVGFPILINNLIRLAMEKSGLAEVQAQRTGVLPEMSFLPDTQYKVIAPDGGADSFATDKEGMLTGVPARSAGFYEIHKGTSKRAQVGVSLLSAEETLLIAAEQINFNELPVSAAQSKIEVDRPLWPLLAGLAMVMLILEWWFYHKRPRGFGR